MKRNRKRLAALVLTMALAASCVSAVPLQASAAAYDDAVSAYTLDDTQKGRITDAAMTTVGNKMYAYVGRNTVGGGGLTVLDVTDPQQPKEIQDLPSITMRDLSWVNERLYAADGCLYVLNNATSKLELYQINADGTLPSKPNWSSQEGYATGTIKAADGLMFVSALSTSATNLSIPSVNIYDISDVKNPVKLTTDTPIQPTMENLYQPDWEVTEQIATYAVSVADLGGGKYRIFGTNRAKFANGVDNKYFLSIRDVTITDGTYKVSTVYEGQPAGTAFETAGDSVYDIDALNENIIAIVEGGNKNGINELELIDVSAPDAPKKITDNGTDGQGTSVFVDGNRLFLTTKDRRVDVYQYSSGTLSKERTIVPDNSAYQMGVYAGFLYGAFQSAFALYEYNTAISIDSGMTEDVKPVLAGTVEGYLPATDRVAVTVDGQEYTAAVGGNRFSADLEGLVPGEYTASAKLMRMVDSAETELAATDAITISIAQGSNPDGMIQLGSIPMYQAGTRIVDAVSMTAADGRTYLYTAYAVSDKDPGVPALVVYDITDVTDYSALTPYQVCTDIQADVFNNQLQIKDGYLFVSQKRNESSEDNTRVLKYYKIGQDGKLPQDETGTAGTVLAQGPGGGKFGTVEILGDYLFYARQDTSGFCAVYDVSDIESGIQELGRTPANYGVFAPAIEQISDSLYRLCYVSRTDQTIDGVKPGQAGYQLVISDMQAADGSVSFTQQYSGIDVLPDPTVLGSINDIDLIGDSQAFMVCSSGETAKRFLINFADPARPAVTAISNDQALSAENLNDSYYAVGTQGGTLGIYQKSDHTAVKSFSGLGQIYTMYVHNGKMFAATDKNIHVFQLFTTTTSTVDTFSVVRLEVTDRDGFPVSDVSPGELTVTAQIYNPEETAEPVEMYLAVYDSITGRLDYVQQTHAVAEHGMNTVTDTIKMTELADYSAYTRCLKVFVWDKNMQALGEAYPVKQAELINGSIWEMYVPPETETETVKGVLLVHQHGIGVELAHMKALQSFCAERDMAMMSFLDDNFVLKDFFKDPETASKAIFSKLNEFAIKTGHPELNTVPLATFGHSNASAFSAGFAEYNPERVFAAVAFKSARADQFEYDTFAEYDIPLLVITGEYDWDYGYVDQIFASERMLEKGALVQYIQDPGATHGSTEYKSNTIMFEFLDKAYQAKVANAAVAEDGTVTMGKIDKTTGYIGYGEYTVEDSGQSKSGYQYKYVPKGYMTYAEYLETKQTNPDFKAQAWLFDEEYAKDWMEFNINGVIDVDYPYKD